MRAVSRFSVGGIVIRSVVIMLSIFIRALVRFWRLLNSLAIWSKCTIMGNTYLPTHIDHGAAVSPYDDEK